MRKFLCLLVAAAFASTLLHGCAGMSRTVQDNPRTAIGAGAGAVGGAVVGGLIGGKRGAIAGGLLGALAGGAIGQHLDRQERTLAQTRQAYARSYTPDQGTRLKIESVRANPAVLPPGETVDIHVTYAVLTPSDDTLVPVKETREILHDGRSVGKTSLDLEREGGTWRSTVPITLPADAAPGKYTVVASVESRGGGKDVQETSFRVAGR